MAGYGYTVGSRAVGIGDRDGERLDCVAGTAVFRRRANCQSVVRREPVPAFTCHCLDQTELMGRIPCVNRDDIGREAQESGKCLLASDYDAAPYLPTAVGGIV